MGIKNAEVDAGAAIATSKLAATATLQYHRYDPGAKATATLYTPANVVNGDTITVGVDVMEVDIINTDAGVNLHAADGALNATDTVSNVLTTAAPATAISVGDVIRIENEMLLVIRKISTTSYVCVRAYAGTTIATHAADTDIYVSDSVPAVRL